MVMARLEAAGRNGLASVGVSATPTPAVLTPVDIARINARLLLSEDRDRHYQHYQDYYDGRHHDPRELDFGDHEVTATRHTPFSARHNLCALVVDALVERLSVVGFQVSGDGLSEAAASAYAAELWRWWQDDRNDA